MSEPRSAPHGRATRAVLVVTAAGAVVLLPWVVYLAASLPETPPAGAWRLAWVGYDVALGLALAVTAWLVWTRRRGAAVGLIVSSTLIVSDAWFDVCLSWGTPGQTWSLVSAFALELPVAILLAREASRVLADHDQHLLRSHVGPGPSPIDGPGRPDPL